MRRLVIGLAAFLLYAAAVLGLSLALYGWMTPEPTDNDNLWYEGGEC